MATNEKIQGTEHGKSSDKGGERGKSTAAHEKNAERKANRTKAETDEDEGEVVNDQAVDDTGLDVSDEEENA